MDGQSRCVVVVGDSVRAKVGDGMIVSGTIRIPMRNEMIETVDTIEPISTIGLRVPHERER